MALETNEMLDRPKTADDFMQNIRPFGPLFGGEGTWYYRGHANAEWPLLSLALRRDANGNADALALVATAGPTRYLDNWHHEPPINNGEQVQVEAKWLLEFLNVADLAGLSLPGDPMAQRRSLEDIIFRTAKSTLRKSRKWVLWPPDDLLPLVALAQHHGVPTRLLDWSRSAYVAAYFAAAEAAKWVSSPGGRDRRGATDLCVFGIPDTRFDVSSLLGNAMPGKRVSRVFTPAAPNANLFAQKALFLLDRPPEGLDLNARVDSTPLDQAIRSDWSLEESAPPIATKILLPIKEAPRLLRLLSIAGIDAAAVLPGYDGVFAAIQQRRYWDKG